MSTPEILTKESEESEAGMDAERLLTPAEVAERLGCSVITVKAWLRRGRLPLTRLGEKGLLRVREEDMNAYIRKLAEDSAKGKRGT
jgi:excisionase family DNA binding protein